MAGRPPTPIAVHKARGTFRKGRHEGKLALSDEKLGPAPGYFNDVSREEWARLSNMAHIHDSHRAVVEHHCVMYSRFVDDAMGIEPMRTSDRAIFHSIQMQLGLTPASAGKIAAPQAKKVDDPWSALG